MSRPWLSRLRFANNTGGRVEPPVPVARRTGPSPLARAAALLARDVVARIRQLIGLAFLIIEAIIALRILLKVMGANPDAGFSSFVYKLSSPFVAPFHPVFADANVNGHPFELGSLFGIVIYSVLGYLVARLVRVLLSKHA